MPVMAVLVLCGVIYLDHLRRQAEDVSVLTSKYRLYALRDALRELAMQGEIRSTNWVFQYLDSSIARTIASMSRITLLRVGIAAILYRDDDGLRRARAHLQQELEKTANETLARIHLEYVVAVGLAVLERSVSAWFVLHAAPNLFALSRRVSSAMEYPTEIPETSTLTEFAPA